MNFPGGAGAVIRHVAALAALARVEGADEHEAGRVGDGGESAGNGHPAVFQRLAQYFQHVLLEFGQFVQEQHSVVGERNFSRPWRISPSYEANVIFNTFCYNYLLMNILILQNNSYL